MTKSIHGWLGAGALLGACTLLLAWPTPQADEDEPDAEAPARRSASRHAALELPTRAEREAPEEPLPEPEDPSDEAPPVDEDLVFEAEIEALEAAMDASPVDAPWVEQTRSNHEGERVSVLVQEAPVIEAAAGQPCGIVLTDGSQTVCEPGSYCFKESEQAEARCVAAPPAAVPING